MNQYEMVVLYHPDLEIDLEKPLKKVETILKNNKGAISKQDNWGKRKLAYTISGEDHAIYVYYEIELPAEAVGKVESTLNITDEVLRYLIAKPGPVIEEDDSDGDDKKSSEKSDKKSETEEKTNE